MNNRKRVIPLCLALAMVSAAPVTAIAGPEFAHTSEEWEKLRDNVMEYGELGDLVHEYNPTVRNNQASYVDYAYKDRKDVSDDYWKLALDLYEQVNYPAEDDANYATLYANARMAEIQAKQYKQQAISNMEDSNTKLWGYEQAEARLVSNAQASMIGYQQALLQLEQAQNSKKISEESYQSVLAKSSAGMATEAEVLSAKQGVLDAEAQITSLQRSIQNTKQKLCIMTGWSYDAEPEILKIPTSDFSRIAAMNPEAEKEKALAANYTLLINQRKLQNATDSLSINNLKTTIEDNKQKISSDIDITYHAVLQAQVDYQQACADLEVEAQKMDTARRKYETGSMSRMAYNQQENSYQSKVITKELKDLALYQTMETYDWNVKGLGSSV